MIASDIHGSAWYCRKMMEALEKEQADRLILLGDLLYHGPRNDLPKEYAPKEVIRMLNKEKNRIYNVRGNCDAEVDQMLLDFPILSDYTLLVDNGKRFFLTHGHIYNEDRLPKGRFDCLFYGHTHRWKLERTEHTAVCNTGSITFPKDGNMPTFAIYCDGTVSVHRLDGSRLKELSL